MSDIVINGTTYNGVNSITVGKVGGGTAKYTEGGEVSGTIDITTNGIHNVADYENANVNVAVPEDISHLSSLALGMITGIGDSQEIIIPTDAKYTAIRDYAYHSQTALSDDLFYKHNLTIPNNITTIGTSCFNSCNLTGKLTVPATVTKIGMSAFRYCALEEVELNCQNLTGATYVCGHNPYLKKAVLNAPIPQLLSYSFAECTSLEEVHLPSTLTSISANAFNKCTGLKFIKFNNPTPCVVPANLFYYTENVVFVVPYQSYDAYLNATNFQYLPRAQYGFGDFVTGDTLPSSVEGYTITWHKTLDDAKSGTNAVTTADSAGTYYGAFTATA